VENQKPPEEGVATSLVTDTRPVATTPAYPAQNHPSGSFFKRIRLSWAHSRIAVFVGLGVIVLLGGAYALKIRNDHQANNAILQPSDNFSVQDIPLKGLTDPSISGLSTLQSLSINGQLRVNNSLIITPGSQPKKGTAGQVYYDKDGNFLSYYDGEQYLSLANSEDVASLQDQLDELFDNLSVSEESFSQEDFAILSDDNVFSGFNVFEGGLESSDLAVTGAAVLQGDLGVDGTTDLADLNVSGTTTLGPTTASSLVLSSPLDVSSGGTGATSFTNNEILLGQGSSPITTVTAAGPGLCLVSTAGAPAFQACPGGGAGVDSLNGLTGVLSIANASGAGTTITIDNASTVAKGIASFNATNFSVSSGAVNTIQNIAITSTPTFAGLTLNGNLSVGSNSIVTSGATIGSAELDVLDGGISEGEVTGVITDVTAGNGLAGGAASGNATINIASANGGIVVNADNIALTLQPTGDALSATTSSGSGLEILGTGLSLLQGCNDTQILKWNETTDVWGCADDAGGSGLGDDITVNGSTATNANFIDTVASGSAAGVAWTLNTVPSPDDISITISNASGTQAGVVTTGVQSFAGDKTFNNALTVTGLFTANGGVTVEAGDTFTVNGDGFTDLTGTGLTISGGALQTTLGVAIDSSEITDLTITGADIADDTIALGTKTTGNYVANTTAGTGIAVTGAAGEGWSPTISLDYSSTLASNSLAVNQSSFAATGVLFEGTADGFETLLTLADPTADNTITLPNASGTVCLVELGNCAGSGSGVTTSGGTTNRLAKFTGAQAINDSTITDDGTNVTTTVSMIIQGGNVTAGTNAQLGSFILNDGNGQTTTLRAGDSAGNLTFILPTNVGSQFQCLKYDTAGQLIWDNCDGGSGGGSGVTALNGLTGGVTIQGNAQIGVSASSPNINLSINADSIDDGQLAFNTGQHLTVTSTPTFSGLIVTGDTTANRPAGTEGRVYYDTTTKQLLVYANGKWQADRTSVTKTVAPSNAPQYIKDTADYVADGTGDQAEINSALTAAAGGKVYLFEGTLVANATILVPNNTTLAGAGRGTLIELADLDVDENLIENSDTGAGTGVRIQDLRLDGRLDLNTAGVQNGISFDGMGAGSGASARQGGLISGVVVNNFRNHGIFMTASLGNIVQNTRTQGNGTGGIGLNTSADYNTLTNNMSQGNVYGIIVGSNNNTVVGNTVQGNTTSGIDLSFGDSNTVTGNTVTGNSQYGIRIINGANSNIVSGNRIMDSGGATTNNGIYIDASDSNSITGNYISDASATTNNYAINVFNATSDNTYIANNNIDGGTINDAGTGTTYGGQVNGSGNFMIQPSGTIELMKNTNITGTLNVTSNVDTNGSLTVGNADQFVVSNLGVVTAGTWQGGTIADTYVADTLTVNSSSTVDWQALNNYPAACGAGQAVTQLGDTITCQAFASSSGSGNYIQNQFAGAQATADFWISGTGRADTALQAPTFDTATAATLTLGGNATSISVVDDVTLATGKSLTVTGGNTASRPAGSEGMIYYDTETDQLLTFANGKWQAESREAVLVAASDSSPAAKAAADYIADGTADEAEITSAITEATTTTGNNLGSRKVYLFAGTYTIADTISLPNNFTLTGAGKGTLLQFAALGAAVNKNMITNTTTGGGGTGITIRDLKLDGNKAGNATGGLQYGIYLNGTGTQGAGNTPGATVTDTAVQNFKTIGIYLDSAANNTITNNSIQASGSHNIYLNNTNHNFIDNNTITDATLNGIYLNTAARDIVTSNFIGSNAGFGIRLDSGNGNTINGNVLRNNTASSSDSTIYLVGSDGNNINNNNIVDNAGTGYAIDISDAGSDNNYLSNNIYSGTGASSINDASGGDTIYTGQADGSGNYMLQPSGTIELMKNTNVTGTLNVTSNVDTNGSLTVGNANQFIISNLGVVTAGAWQGTAINDTYVADTLTVDSASSVHWQALNNYPAACGAGNAVTQLGDTVTCSAFATGSASSYIQNQNAGAQATADFWISGTGRADTALQAPTFDTATAATLTLGGNATSISVVDDVTLAAGKSLTVTGGNTGSRPAGTEGMVYYDTDTDKLLIYSNGKWQADRTDAVIVAASNSSQADKDAADYLADGDTGAAGDGDQVQVNAALTAATGKKVVLLAGTYTVDAAIAVPTNTTLTGVGPGSVVTIPNSFNTTINIISASGTDAVVENLMVDQNTANQTSGTIVSISSSGSNNTVKHTKHVNIRSTGISISAGSEATAGIVRDNLVDCTNGDPGASSTAIGISITGSTTDNKSTSTAEGNSVHNCGTGIRAQSRVSVLDNNITAGRTTGIDLQTVVNASIADNNVSMLYGNFSNTFGTSALTGSSVTRSSISGNTFASAFSMVDITTMNGSVFSDNTMEDSANGMLYITTGTNNTISGNVGYDSTANQNRYSLSALSTSVISDNVTARISLDSTSHYNQVLSNQINGTGVTVTNILDVNGDNTTVTDNVLYGVGSGYIALKLAATADSTYLADNRMVNSSGATFLSDSGTNTIYGGQVNDSGNFMIQPTGTIELLKNTNVTGTLNVTSNVDTNGSLTVGNADQFVISNLGVVSAGTWQGTAINDTYVADTLTVDSASSVHWQALNNYPAACAAGQAITQLGDSITCSAFATGTGNDIQNQFASAQTSADFWISGTGRADTALQAPTFDTATAATLTLGGTATSISVVDDVTLAAGKSLTVTGGNTGSRPAGTEGMVYYDSDTDKLLVYSNGKWQADRTDAILVAASNSSQADKDAADYLADGNTGGAADGDQVQINAALTAASGKKVVLLAGTYVADETILVPNNTTLNGVGKGTLIELADIDVTDNLIENTCVTGAESGCGGVLGTGVTIRDLRLDGRKDLNTAGVQRGISFASMGGGTGSSARNGALVTGVTVTSFRNENIYLSASSNNTISNNVSIASSSEGIQLTGSSLNNVVSGNRSQGNSTNGILVNSSSTGNTLSGNNAQGNTTAGIQINAAYNTISGNTTAGGSYGVFIGSTNNTVTGNNAQGNSSAGFHVTSTGNEFSGNVASGGTYGFNINAASNNLTGNTAQSNTYGIYLNSDYITATGNTVNTSTTYGIYLNNADSNIISGNKVHDSGGSTTNNGIYLFTSISNSIVGNSVSDISATTDNFAINLSNTTVDATYVADNTLGTGSIRDQSDATGGYTIYGGQLNSSGNYVIQPAGTVELMANTNVTGTLNVTGNVDTNGSLTVGNADQFVISNTGVVTSGTWNGSTIGVPYGGTGATTFTSGGVLYGNGTGALLATAAGGATQCLLGGATPTWGTCTATNLQGTYDASSPATIDLSDNKNFTINAADTATDSSIVFNLQCTTCSASGGRFAIQDAGVDIFTVNPNGDLILGTASNNMTLVASNGYKPVLNGTAQNTKYIRLHAEYPSVVLTADGSNNLGTMTSGYSQTDRMNYYNWTTTQGTNQDYDIVVQVPLPADFASWNTNPISISTYSSDLTNGLITLEARDSGGTQQCNFVNITPGQNGTPASTNTWVGPHSSACTLSAGTYTAGDYITLRIKLQAPNGGSTRVGNITLSYKSKF